MSCYHTVGVYRTEKENLYVNFSLLRLTYKQDSDGRSQFEAASGAAMDIRNSHDDEERLDGCGVNHAAGNVSCTPSDN